MQTILLKGATALDLAYYIKEQVGQIPSEDLQYVEIRAGDPSGCPDGSDWVEVRAVMMTTIGDDSVSEGREQ